MGLRNVMSDCFVLFGGCVFCRQKVQDGGRWREGSNKKRSRMDNTLTSRWLVNGRSEGHCEVKVKVKGRSLT